MPDWDSLVTWDCLEKDGSGKDGTLPRAQPAPGQQAYHEGMFMHSSWKSCQLAVAERDWHLHQLRTAPLTAREREYHQDMVSWLEHQYALRAYDPSPATVQSHPLEQRA